MQRDYKGHQYLPIVPIQPRETILYTVYSDSVPDTLLSMTHALPIFISQSFIKDVLLISPWCIRRKWRTEELSCLLEVIYLINNRAGMQSNYTSSPNEVSVVNMFIYNKNLSAWTTLYLVYGLAFIDAEYVSYTCEKNVVSHNNLPHCLFSLFVLLPGANCCPLICVSFL